VNSNQKKLHYLTPGPSELHPEVPGFIKDALENGVASISHRSKTFEGYYSTACEELLKLLAIPKNFSIFFLGSATEAMERIIQGGSQSKTTHFVNGAFSKKFAEIAKAIGRNAATIEAKEGQGFDLLQSKIAPDTELIALTHNETSSGVALKIEQLHQLKALYPNSLIAVDIVSSAPVVKLDFTKLDFSFFSVQKLFGLPAGLGVLIASEAAIERARTLRSKGFSIGSHHNLIELQDFYKKSQTPATPNVLAIYLLGRMAQSFNRIGAQKLRAEIEERAALAYKKLDNAKTCSAFVAPEYRSSTVLVINTSAPAPELISKFKAHGFEIGSGYGAFKDKQVRIANFPAIDRATFESAISLLD